MSEDTVTIKEYFTELRKADQRALDAALIANEKRLDGLNELRQGVATTDQLDALEKVVSALSRLVYIGLGAVLALQIVLQFVGKP
jgi:hypothetical protein